MLQEPTITSGHLEVPKPLWHERGGGRGGGGRGRGRHDHHNSGRGQHMANGNGGHWQANNHHPPAPLTPGAHMMLRHSLGGPHQFGNQQQNAPRNPHTPMRPTYHSQQVGYATGGNGLKALRICKPVHVAFTSLFSSAVLELCFSLNQIHSMPITISLCRSAASLHWMHQGNLLKASVSVTLVGESFGLQSSMSCNCKVHQCHAKTQT